MNVVLVSNSAAVLERKMGKLIDSSEIIVRFNNFATIGFEDYVGSRTDIIARRSCDDVILHKLTAAQKVLNFVSYSRYWQGMEKVARSVKGFYGPACTTVPVSFCKQTGLKLGLEQPVPEACSIGILAIDWLLQTYPKLHLYGFTGDNTHYFPKPPKDGSFHSWEKEQAYISKLKKEGKIEIV